MLINRIFSTFAMCVILISTAFANTTEQNQTSKPESVQLLVDLESQKEIVSDNTNSVIDADSLSVIFNTYTVLSYLQDSNKPLETEFEVKIKEKNGKPKHFSVSIKDFLVSYILSQDREYLIELLNNLNISDKVFIAHIANQITNLSLNNSTINENGEIKTSIKDATTLTIKLYEKFSFLRIWARTESINFANKKVFNTNSLIYQSNAINGIVSGKSGNNKVAITIYENKRNNNTTRRLLAASVVGEDDNIDETIMNLIALGYRQYETVVLYPKHSMVTQVRIYQGEKEKVSLAVSEPVILTLPKSELFSDNYKNHLKAFVSYDKNIKAPIKVGDKLATLIIKYDSKIIEIVPLVAQEDIHISSLFTKLVDGINMSNNKSKEK